MSAFTRQKGLFLTSRSCPIYPAIRRFLVDILPRSPSESYVPRSLGERVSPR